MDKKINGTVQKLNSELQANGGIMPDSWKPYAELIQILLTIAMVFTNDATDEIIISIIAAIELAQNN